MQFAPGEDLDRYPRTLDADLEVCAAEGVDVVFAPGGRGGLPRRQPRLVRDGVTVDPGPLGDDPRGRVAARPLPRRAHRRRQAVRPGPPRRRGLRPEGLPAARADPPDGRATSAWPSRSSAPRPCASPTAWRCPAATATSTPSSGWRAVALQPRAARGAASARRTAYLPRAGARDADARGRAGRRARLPRAHRARPRRAPRSAGEARILVAARVGTTRLIDNIAHSTSNGGPADAAHHDEEQDPPGHRDPGRPALRRLGDRRRGPARRRRPAARRAGAHRRRHQRRPARDLHDRRRARLAA